MAKIYPLHRYFDGQSLQAADDLKKAFTAEHLAFFLLALDTSARVGSTSPRGLKALQRAFDLLLEAKNTFEREFN